MIITTSFIVANTISLAMEKYPSTKTYDQILEICNIVFTISFAVEMLLKIIGLGFLYILKFIFLYATF